MNERLDITKVVNEYLCHSCGACHVACPKDCISYKETVGGYVFPKIDYDICIDCELCLKVCSGDHFGKTLQDNLPDDPFIGNILTCQVGKATNKDIFENSQNGGVVTAFLANLLDTKQIEFAIVATTSQTIPPKGDFAIVKDSKELLKAQKSKYVPIPLLSILPEIKKVHGTIAIVGLSCHFHNLQNLADTFPWIRKKNIIKIGLICDRVMTNKSIDFISSQATKEPIKEFVFRNKLKSSYPGNPTIKTITNKEFILDKSLRMNMKDFFTPVRCRLCFDKLNIFADIVCGDPHGVDNIDRIGGETLVFGRTQKGIDIIDNAKKMKVVNLRDTDKTIAVEGQKIEKNRKDWLAHIIAWQNLGKKIPEYAVINKSVNNTFLEEKNLKQALSLDKYYDKNELLEEAQNYYNRKKRNQKLFLPLRVLKRILKEVIKRIK